MADRVTRFADNEVVTTDVFNQRVDEANAGFAAVEQAIDGLAGTGGEIPGIKEKDIRQDERLDAVDTAVANAEKDIATNDARDDAQDTQIAEYGQSILQHGTDITELKADVESHGQRLTTLEGDVASAKADISQLEQDKAAVAALNAVKATADAALPKAGGTMTGKLVAASGTDYTTARVRNIICATDTNVTIADGDVLHVYK